MHKKLTRQDSKITKFSKFRTWWFSNLYGQDFEQFWMEILPSKFNYLNYSDLPHIEMLFPRFRHTEGKLVSEMETLRIEKGWTQEELAEKSGLSLKKIKRMESKAYFFSDHLRLEGFCLWPTLKKLTSFDEFVAQGEKTGICWESIEDIWDASMEESDLWEAALALKTYRIFYMIPDYQTGLGIVVSIQSSLENTWKRYKMFPTHNSFCEILDNVGCESFGETLEYLDNMINDMRKKLTERESKFATFSEFKKWFSTCYQGLKQAQQAWKKYKTASNHNFFCTMFNNAGCESFNETLKHSFKIYYD